MKQAVGKIDSSVKQLIEVQLSGEVRKNVEEQVVQFTDTVKQQLEDEMKTQVDKSLEIVTEDLQKVRTSLGGESTLDLVLCKS